MIYTYVGEVHRCAALTHQHTSYNTEDEVIVFIHMLASSQQIPSIARVMVSSGVDIMFPSDSQRYVPLLPVTKDGMINGEGTLSLK